MTTIFPKPQLILDYKIFFNQDPPENRLDLIKDTPTEALLYELVGLNYRLKPKNEIHINDSLDFQAVTLEYFLKDNDLFRKYAGVAEKYTKDKNDYPHIFTRQSCLFAIEELLNSNFVSNISNEEFGTLDHWESIVKYLLSVNTEITKIKEGIN